MQLCGAQKLERRGSGHIIDDDQKYVYGFGAPLPCSAYLTDLSQRMQDGLPAGRDVH